MTQKFRIQIIILVILTGLLLINCSSNVPAVEESTVTPDVPEEAVVKIVSPVSPVSPPPTPTLEPKIAEPFTLAEPIEVGATAISGTGPAGVPIKIFEVANTADLLGETVTGADGTFSITFDRPLRPTERVGVTLGDLSGTDFEERDFIQVSIRSVPTYGLILADVEVQP